MTYTTTERVYDFEYTLEWNLAAFATYSDAYAVRGEGLITHPTSPNEKTFANESPLAITTHVENGALWFDAASKLSGNDVSNRIDLAVGVPPESSVQFLGWRHSEKVPNFKELCNNGVIVTNRLDVCEYVLSSEPKKTVVSVSEPRAYSVRFPPRTQYQGWIDLGMLQLVKDKSGLSRHWPFSNGMYSRSNYSVSGYYRNIKYSHEFNFVPPHAVGEIISFIEVERALDPVLVTEATADANDNEFDILTEMAEMPETVRSLLDGFNALADIAMGLKRKEIRITNSTNKYMDRVARRRYKEYLRRRTKGRYKVMTLAEFKSKNLTRLRQETQIEINDALATVRLTTSYTIMPIVYSIQDGLSAIERFDAVYRTTRKRNISKAVPTVSGYKFEGECEVTRRCWIKRSYKLPDTASKLAAVLSADMIVTAWDKIPLWSIIIDWFLTVGSFLKAIPWNPRYDQNQSTYSTKIEIDGKFIELTGNSSFSIKGSSYLREKINPTDHIGIYYNNEFDFKRAQDLAAFIWVKLRGLSISTKERV